MSGVDLLPLLKRERVNTKPGLTEEGGVGRGHHVWLVPAYRIEPPCEWCGDTKVFALPHTVSGLWKLQDKHGHWRLIIQRERISIGLSPSMIESDDANPEADPTDVRYQTMRPHDFEWRRMMTDEQRAAYEERAKAALEWQPELPIRNANTAYDEMLRALENGETRRLVL